MKSLIIVFLFVAVQCGAQDKILYADSSGGIHEANTRPWHVDLKGNIIQNSSYSFPKYGYTFPEITRGKSEDELKMDTLFDMIIHREKYCHHIYVAVQDSVVIWDKREQPITYSGGGQSMYWHYPKPDVLKIICVLCHKVTEQKIKIINE